MACELQLKSVGGGRGSERYRKLLNSIAKDLDCMLSDLHESSSEVNKRSAEVSHSGKTKFYLSTKVQGLNSNGTTCSLPHFPTTASAAGIGERPNTVPRRRNVCGEQRGSWLEAEEPAVDGKSNRVNININPQGCHVESGAFGGGSHQEDSEEEKFGKLPGVEGYQNDAHRLTTSTAATESESDDSSSSNCDYAHPSHMSMLERLIVTHSLWLLRGIYRAGAVHLLQGKEEGNFIIRQSSRKETMAITVRLPPDKGPYIEHYLIEAIDGKLRLEGSDYHFPAIPMLVSHYCQCCDELPVRLKLPRAVVEAKTKQELSALALLGQDFWMSPLANSNSRSFNAKSKVALPLPTTATARPSFSTFTSPPPSATSSPSSNSSQTASSNSSPTSPVKKTAPPPPPRRSLSSPSAATSTAELGPNFTVTTTVTFHVNRCTASLPVEVDDNKVENEEEVILPPEPTLTASTTSTLSRRTLDRHQTLSPLESPPGYHRNSLADKISDYEDIWANKTSPDETSNQTDLEKALARLSLNGSTRSTVGSDLRRITKRHRHSDPSLRSSPLTAQSSKSSCNSEPEALNKSMDEAALKLLPGGIINNGFQSSSSQLLNESNSEGRCTLPRENEKSHLLKDFKDLMIDQSLTPTATLKGVQTNRSFTQNSWPLDFSWEFRSKNGSSLFNDSSSSSSSIDHEDFMTEDDEVALVELRNKPANPRSPFRVFSASTNSSSVAGAASTTVEQLLTEKQPQLKVPEIRPLTHSNLLRVSEYDNLGSSDTEDDDDSESLQLPPPTLPYERSSCVNRLSVSGAAGVELRGRNVPSEAGSSMTEFSEPWDSHRWETILMHAAALNRVAQSNEKVCSSTGEQLTPSVDLPDETVVEEEEDLQSVSSVAEGTPETKIKVKIPVLPCLLSLRRKDRRQGRPIRDYIFKMAQDKDLIFGRHIENFIACTLESHEVNPHVVMRNIRQFMSGMANYLVNSGEGQFSKLVQEQRAKLKQNEFLNLDAILEGVLHRIVVKPLKQHIYQLFVKAYSANGAVAMLSDSIKFARSRTPEQLGLKAHLIPPKAQNMEKIKYYFTKLQKAYSPLKKLENLLAAISFIYHSVLQEQEGEHQSLGADDFLPLLLYVLVHCGLIAAEVEAEYMWGLLHPSLLSGEGGYYLTTLSSAVHVLKNLQRSHDSDRSLSKYTVSPDGRRVGLCLGELDGFMKVLIPNEQNGSIMSKTVPVRPNMTSKDICRMVAHRLSVTNPQDYALFKLTNGEEVLLSEGSYPWMVRMELAGAGLEVAFVYKRVDAKLAWPVSLKKC